MSKRRNYSPQFKAKVALETLRGELTQAQLAAKHGIHPNVITKWKREATDNIANGFSGKLDKRDRSHDCEIKDLHAKIGELTVERDFLARAFDR